MKEEIVIYYDKDCPICKEYIKYIKLKEKFHIQVCNAREYINKMEQFKKDGFDINEGIILEYNGKIYQGDKAIFIMDSLIESKTIFDKFVSFLITIPYLLKLTYPLLKLCRLLLLKTLRLNSKIL